MDLSSFSSSKYSSGGTSDDLGIPDFITIIIEILLEALELTWGVNGVLSLHLHLLNLLSDNHQLLVRKRGGVSLVLT